MHWLITRLETDETDTDGQASLGAFPKPAPKQRAQNGEHNGITTENAWAGDTAKKCNNCIP